MQLQMQLSRRSCGWNLPS